MNTSPLIKYLSCQLYSAIIRARLIETKGDIEHLHRFRVAIRRSRSLLKLYLPDAYAIISVLKEIVQKTNELRELDVFLLTLNSDEYPKLTKRIKEVRDKRFEMIWSESFANETISSLNRLYDELHRLPIDITDKRLTTKSEKFYAKSLRSYNRLSKDESADKLHELRIRFKISRYSLEFLNESGLHDEQAKIKECKQIQDHFGDIQDVSNQLQWLKHFCDENPIKECKKLIKEHKQYLHSLKDQLSS